MSWEGLSAVDQKECFVLDAFRPGSCIAGLCRTYGISRQTGYRWIRHYRSEGRQRLESQSRRPHTCPGSWSPLWHERALELRRQYHWGGRKLSRVLQNRHPEAVVPGPSTIDRWIADAGLAAPRPKRRRYPPRSAPMADVVRPGQTYCVDFKGEFLMGDGAYCYPLTVTDAYSRYLLGCYALPGALMEPTIACFEDVFTTYGVPERIRSDNGTPFASTGLGRFSRLSVWWYRLGVTVERTDLGRPDQNGRHERFHRTLKRDTTNPPGTDLDDQQHRFDDFRRTYNHIRPHESLGMQRPADVFTKPTQSLPDQLPPFTYPTWYEVRSVRPCGEIWWRGRAIHVGKAFVGQRVGLQATDEGLWQLWMGDLLLGQICDQAESLQAHDKTGSVSNRRRSP